MRLRIMKVGMILAAMVFLASCNGTDSAVNINTNNQNSSNNTPIGPATVYADGARRITTEELETLMKEDKAYIIDVRLEDAYNLGHIPGSHLIPAADILNHLNKLPRDKMIVTYCS